jgi:AraC-like DNA-binding protein/phosphoribosylformylglycinamidine (FGAM) synthase PurS component
VTDPVASEIVRAAHELGLHGVHRAATGLRFQVEGLKVDEVEILANQLLANNVIQHWKIGNIEPSFPEEVESSGTVEPISIRNLSDDELKDLQTSLNKVGFELIETRVNKIVEDIKQRILEYLAMGMDSQNIKLSSFITQKINYDYSYLSDLFSSIEGKTIEQFFILQRIEKVKELIVYDQLSLTEISYQTGFSSVHHLSAQFKKITGLSPSHFKKIAGEKRKSLDKV